MIPHNLEAEESVLGSMILSHKAVAVAQELLVAEDFYREAHRKIYQVLIELYAAGKTTDPVVLAGELKRRGLLEAVGDRAYIATLLDTTPNPYNMRHYAKTVREMALRRQLIEAGAKISQLGQSLYGDLSDQLGEAESEIYAVGDRMREERICHIAEPVRDSYNRMMEAGKLEKKLTGVPTGFWELDGTTHGLQPSNLIIVGGRTSMGKTAFAVCVAHYLGVECNIPVFIFSLEMNRVEVAERLILCNGDLDSTTYRIGALSPDEMARARRATEAISRAPIFIDDRGDRNLSQMRSIARQMRSAENIQLFIVDYIQLLYGREKSESRAQEMSRIARQLKVMAMELKVPVMAVSQLRRKPQDTRRKEPEMEDLKESGGIEQNADLVLLLYRPEVDKPHEDELRGLADLTLAKHRNGMTKKMRLYWCGASSKFLNPQMGDR